MSQSKTDKFIQDYCKEHDIDLIINSDVLENCGACYPTINEIHLSQKYTSRFIKLAVFLHEAGHILVEYSDDQPSNGFECEHFAWFEAIKLHKKYFNKSFSKTQTSFMLSCLMLYSENQYQFNKNSYIKQVD